MKMSVEKLYVIVILSITLMIVSVILLSRPAPKCDRGCVCPEDKICTVSDFEDSKCLLWEPQGSCCVTKRKKLSSILEE